MRILVLPVGSHGDVHPLLGISLALRARGHEVTVASNEHFEGLVQSAGLPFLSTGTDADFREALADPNLWHPLRGFKTVMEKGVVPVMRRTYDLIRQHFPDPAGTVIVAAGIAFGARIAQDKHGYRVATLQLQPSVFRSVHENPKLPGMFMPQGMPKILKHLVWSFADAAVVEPICRPPINAFRRELGLPPVKGILKEWWNSPALTLGLFPEWFAPMQPDWPKQTRLTGFPLYDEKGITPLSPELLEFLEAHPNPVAFTPGSAHVHAEAFFAESARACELLGRPGLLLTRHADQIPAKLPPMVKHVPYAPFSQLLPYCSALVHHGGIGTTAQALRAGRPQLVVPFSHDQFDNAARARRLGVADTLSARRYRAAMVAEKLRAMVDSTATAANCREVAARFEGVDAIAAACDQIEALHDGSPIVMKR